MATLTVVGVRHHSPACARVVAHALDTLRPRFVLIEGPADMNTRLDELLLPHRTPVALYSYRLSEEHGRARATWAPFCDYSPEWVALRHGRAAGAEPLFIDLPAWDDAFAQVEPLQRRAPQRQRPAGRARAVSGLRLHRHALGPPLRAAARPRVGEGGALNVFPRAPGRRAARTGRRPPRGLHGPVDRLGDG